MHAYVSDATVSSDPSLAGCKPLTIGGLGFLIVVDAASADECRTRCQSQATCVHYALVAGTGTCALGASCFIHLTGSDETVTYGIV